jgi:hypothetical protein
MGSINGQMKPEIGLNNPEIGLNRVTEHGAKEANTPEPTGLCLRICTHVDWFLRFVGNKWSIQKELSVSLNALFRFELEPSTA